MKGFPSFFICFFFSIEKNRKKKWKLVKKKSKKVFKSLKKYLDINEKNYKKL